MWNVRTFLRRSNFFLESAYVCRQKDNNWAERLKIDTVKKSLRSFFESISVHCTRRLMIQIFHPENFFALDIPQNCSLSPHNGRKKMLFHLEHKATIQTWWWLQKIGRNFKNFSSILFSDLVCGSNLWMFDFQLLPTVSALLCCSNRAQILFLLSLLTYLICEAFWSSFRPRDWYVVRVNHIMNRRVSLTFLRVDCSNSMDMISSSPFLSIYTATILSPM